MVVSPLTRTCETAFHIFGAGRQPGKPGFLSTLDAPDGSEEKLRGEKVPAPRILVREECRERWGEYACDGRRPPPGCSAAAAHFAMALGATERAAWAAVLAARRGGKTLPT